MASFLPMVFFLCLCVVRISGARLSSSPLRDDNDGPPICLKNAPVDLLLIADKTDSVGVENFKLMKELLLKLVEDIDISEDGTHVTIMTYSKFPSILNYFKDESSYNKGKLMELIDNIDATKTSHPTRTDRALLAAATKVFNLTAGDRPGTPNKLVLFTDGKTHETSQPYEEILPLLDGTQITAFGIGRRSEEPKFQEELKKIGGGNFLVFSSYDVLLQRLNVVQEFICGIPCNCMDLVLIADKTKSIGEDDFEKMKEALLKIVGRLDVGEDQTHVAIMTYAKTATVLNDFNSETSYNDEALRDLIDSIPNKLQSPTRTDQALVAADQQLFTAGGGDRPDCANALGLFTDGLTSNSSQPYEEIIPSLKLNKNVHIVAVGIGPKSKRPKFQDELRRIAGDNVILAEDFDALMLAEEIEEIMEKLCVSNPLNVKRHYRTKFRRPYFGK